MQLRVRNRYFFALDIVLLTIASYLSFFLRLDASNVGTYLSGLLLFTALVVVFVPLSFILSGVYARYWQYASVEELLLLVSSMVVATTLATVLGLLTAQLVGNDIVIPRTIPIIFMLLALVLITAPRLVLRLHTLRRRVRSGSENSVLVIGAGAAGSMIVREMQQNRNLGLRVVGFVDDDRRKHGMHIQGVQVRGDRAAIPHLAALYKVKQVIIAMPTAPGKVIREIVGICEQAGVQTKTIPGISELLDGRATVNRLRDVQIEDLLRREPVRADTMAVRNLLRGKRVLITGGGGSIGSELCRQVLRCRPTELVVLGHGENSVFEIENELSRLVTTGEYAGEVPRISTVIANICSPERIRNVFEQYQPEIVFHAAAHKHVPLMEQHPEEAITNNILGTRNVLNAALAVDVERFVLISSDKAVNPTNIMGATKRVAELLVHQAARASGKPYVAVRFGNVLGSRGSVVLTFKRQIAAGGPITLTHPDIRRFFMTIPEAVTLVLQAGVLAENGQVFVLDMGEPIKIADLARDMVELSGLEVGRDIDIIYVGLRPGEKLYEELFIKGEHYERTQHQKIFTASNASSFVPHHLNEVVRELAVAAQRGDTDAIVRGLVTLVPEYQTDQRPLMLPRGKILCAEASRERAVIQPDRPDRLEL